MTIRFKFNIDEKMHETLSRLVKETNATSVAEVIEKSIGLYEWSRQQRLAGYAVGAFKDGNFVKEVMLPFEFKE